MITGLFRTTPGARRAASPFAPRAHGGFSLVELMIAMALGLFLTSGMIAVFSGNKRSAELNDAMSNLQESARFALERMASDVRLAGFQGCPDLNRSSRVTPGAKNPVTTDLRATATTASVVVSEDDWQPDEPTGFDVDEAGAVVGSHALGLQFGGPVSRKLAQAQVDGGTPNPSAVLKLADGPDLPSFALETDDLAVVSNCNLVEIFRVSGVTRDGTVLEVSHGADKNDSGAFVRAHGYADDAVEQAALLEETRVMRLNANVYYVAENGTTNESDDAQRSLYRQSLPFEAANPPTEIVRGVEQLRIAFGQADGLDRMRWVLPGNAAYDPARVESVQIGLLMASRDRIADSNDENTYMLAGQPITAPGATPSADAHAGDRRYRLAFNTTVKVRNRRR